MSLIFELEKYLEVELPSYDLFIFGKNSEQRSHVGKDILNKFKISITTEVLVTFSNITSASINKTNNVTEIILPHIDLVGGIKFLMDACDSLVKLDANKRICLDMTTFDAPHIFFLLKYMKYKLSLNKIDIIYTAPLTYRRDQGGYNFSKGIKEVREIPAFTGRTWAVGWKLLTTLIGFEGRRSMAVLTEVDPKKTITINGFPPYSLEFKDTSVTENKDLINSPSCLQHIEMAASYDPFQIFDLLIKISKSYPQGNMTIVPLGTKPMSLGACLFCLNDERVRVVYPFPNEYVSDNQPGSKVGKSWFYKVSL